jgi:hypothetical protein
MGTKYVIAALSVLFLIMAAIRGAQRGARHPQVRTWFLVGVIFAAVSAWLFSQR